MELVKKYGNRRIQARKIWIKVDYSKSLKCLKKYIIKGIIQQKIRNGNRITEWKGCFWLGISLKIIGT